MTLYHENGAQNALHVAQNKLSVKYESHLAYRDRMISILLTTMEKHNIYISFANRKQDLAEKSFNFKDVQTKIEKVLSTQLEFA